jgi:hypothetical protein
MIVRSPGLHFWTPAWHRVAPPHDGGRGTQPLRDRAAAGEERPVREVVAVTGDGLAAAAERDGTILRVWLEGDAGDLDDADGTADADLEAEAAELAGPVARLLERVHAEAVRLGITLAIVDLRRLERVGWGCLRGLGAWLAKVQALDAARRYEVKLVFDPGLRCQHLGARRCFAIDLLGLADHR